ncbi:MAG: CRISPR-associated protein Csx19 [Anaerolineae bacterium]
MSDHNIHFDQLIHKMQQARVEEADHPTIWGGRFSANRFNEFLSVWRKHWPGMPWRIWEHISDIEFADEPKEPEYLQRAEIFGEGGHLSLRRDDNRWLWRYIGPPNQTKPKGFDQSPECEDFWSTTKASQLRRYEEQVLLWGEDKNSTGLWWDDRVAAANLSYSSSLKGNPRVYIDIWRFTQNGQTAFVWYRGLV